MMNAEYRNVSHHAKRVIGDAGHGVPWPVQKFVGALQGNRAKKGVFITTASFSQEAERYAENLECKVVLIDGAKLAQQGMSLITRSA
jgi:restriction endonuclease Mrr